MKTCSKCKQNLPSFAFYKSSKDGLQSQCKKCKREGAKVYRRKNPDKYNAITKKYRKTVRGTLINRYSAIKSRCENKNCKVYKDYGGRGIKCKFQSSEDFVNYVINVLQVNPKGLDLDRIDNNGHYEPGNIRFVSHYTNMHNRRNSI